MKENKSASLSWLVVSTRDYKKEYDWFWDRKNNCCYGMPKELRTDNMVADLARWYYRVNPTESYYQYCVLMPELQDLDIREAADYLRKWCDDNQITYDDDLDQYDTVECHYWGYDR